MKSLLNKSMLALVVSCVFNSAFAGTVTSNLALKFTQKDECSVGGRQVPSTAFNALSAGQTSAFVPFDVTCTTTTPFNVTLGVGQVTGSTVQSRLLKGDATGEDLAIEIYRDAGLTQVWGMDANVNSLDSNGTNGTFSPTVYMKIPAQASLKPDTYNGTFTVLVSY